ncbi:MAG: hypothetical protein D6706_03600 [Chloroflexi bacterium]|nr:MAG: hypothetical protein D6706_03600 [Chloroflexota bacterium]
MNFPLTLSFKKIALSPQVSVTDANGQLLFYVKQKLFKLKEAITVYADREQTQPLYYINADRIIDFSARYHFTDTNGTELGSIKRDGRRSLWKARYDIADGNQIAFMRIREENGWVKVMDAIFGEVPILGIFSGYVFNPVYLVERPEGELVLKVKKEPAFLESNFTIEKHGELTEAETLPVILGVLLMTMLERMRG